MKIEFCAGNYFKWTQDSHLEEYTQNFFVSVLSSHRGKRAAWIFLSFNPISTKLCSGRARGFVIFGNQKARKTGRRLGITPMLVDIALVIVVLIGGIGVYYLTKDRASTTASGQSLANHSASNSVLATNTAISFIRVTMTSWSGRISTGSALFNAHSGMFNYSVPQRPNEERVLGNNPAQI